MDDDHLPKLPGRLPGNGPELPLLSRCAFRYSASPFFARVGSMAATDCGVRRSATICIGWIAVALNGALMACVPAAAEAVWRPAAAMSVGRVDASATLLSDGRVLVAGGGVNGFSGLASTEVYDPGRNQWDAATPLMAPRLGHTAHRLASGGVLVIGGLDGGGGQYRLATEHFDPVTGVWASAGALAF
jgi:hypothetical protein